jgi:hypothetical protein
VRVRLHPDHPPHRADDEVEQATRVPGGEQDREEGDDQREEDPDEQHGQDDQVRDREEPLQEDLPAGQILAVLDLEHERVLA